MQNISWVKPCLHRFTMVMAAVTVKKNLKTFLFATDLQLQH